MGTSVNRDCQLESRSVLNDFTDEALTTSAGSSFPNGTAGMVNAFWRRAGITCLLGELIDVTA